ncbi:MAG TPA: DUF1987 domain-containing protein [Bacteroidales bacterium]|nr:DUF1987 domain-containing protein [Bacteroidales bacterium]HRR93753.1 DUF1987 domain-containing protein [Bacteroidales bacterium]HRT88755.1 DUF1987 domain-containing protein [Bacteroidales bacterium]
MKDLRNIYIEATSKTPEVDFDSMTGNLILSGRSIPENATELYDPLYKWINQYVLNPCQVTNLRLNLEYFNTASSIWIAKIVKTLSRMDKPDNLLYIHLYFNIEEFDNMETEDIKDAISPVVDIISDATVSIVVKIYGTDDNGEIIKESMVLI